MFTEEITRSFGADYFGAHGFADTISAQQNGKLISDYTTDLSILKQISLTTISYYEFEWLDTAAITIFDFGSTKEYY